MQYSGTTEAKKHARSLLGCLLAGIAILAAMAAGAYWLLNTMFSGVGGGGGIGPT